MPIWRFLFCFTYRNKQQHRPKRAPLNRYILYAIRPFLIGSVSGTLNKIETAIYSRLPTVSNFNAAGMQQQLAPSAYCARKRASNTSNKYMMVGCNLHSCSKQWGLCLLSCHFGMAYCREPTIWRFILCFVTRCS